MMLAPSLLISQVKCGIDNVIDADFEMFKGQRIALVTHAAARTLRETSTAEAFLARTDVTVQRVMSPEHGFYGVVPAGDTVFTDTIYNGVIAHSLYGALRRPSPAMLADVSAVVFDLQDIGVRSYTYLSTMIEVMEACALAKRPLYVLDRPNPLGGIIVDGSIVEDSLMSFVGRIPVPYIHGCTLGELATMANELGWLSRGPEGAPRRCALTVIRCSGWKRSMTWANVGRSWYPTSPNIPTLDAVSGYAVTGLSGELGLLSIGIGTSTPFTVLGAPNWTADTVLESRMDECGVVLSAARFQPAVGKYARQLCSGYYLSFRPATFRPYRAAMTLLHTLAERHAHLYPNAIEGTPRAKMFAKTSGHGLLLSALLRRAPWREIERLTSYGNAEFMRIRELHLLYR